MKHILLYLFLLASSAMFAAETQEAFLHPELESFRPFLNTTYRGEFTNSTPEKPVIDISQWERHLNGNAIRVTHSINQGEYGGESIIFWDSSKKTLVGYYFTTGGFFTVAEIQVKDGSVISREQVTGNQNGITEVKATATLNKDGSMTTKSEYLKEGKWVPGHSATYYPTNEHKVIFK